MNLGEASRIERWINRSEIPILILAFIAVVIYMADLLQVWTNLGVEDSYHTISIWIDWVFVLDLLVKIVFLRSSYLTSPWVVVDVLAALPILASIGLPSSFEGLRFIRGIRLFRALRTLRLLRFIPIVRFDASNQPRTTEMIHFGYAMWVIVPLYAIFFIVLTYFIHEHYLQQGSLIEFYLLLGSFVGLILVIAIVRFLLPAFMSVQIHGLLNVALPSQVAVYFTKHPEDYYRTVRMPATVLFSDIKGFTTAVEKLQGDLNILKGHLERVIDVVTNYHKKYDLIIDKFIGDAIMSFRGGDLVKGDAEEHAWRVVRAALESYQAVKGLNDPYFSEIKIGGASSDNLLIGAFGTSSRLSYTILGDRVNLAARLESAVKQCGTQNLFCSLTYQLLKKKSDLVWRRFGKIRVEGKKETMDIYEVFDIYDVPNQPWLIIYHAALVEFEMKRFASAETKFIEVNSLRPGGDKPSLHFADLCQKLIATPPPPNWEPVFLTYK